MAQYSGFDDNEYVYEEQQRAAPSGEILYHPRPIVDPEAEGEVDPNLWVSGFNHLILIYCRHFLLKKIHSLYINFHQWISSQ